jgi:hypothetical protein
MNLYGPRPRCIAEELLPQLEYCRSIQKLRLPLSNLVGMNVELLSQLGQHLVASDGG